MRRRIPVRVWFRFQDRLAGDYDEMAVILEDMKRGVMAVHTGTCVRGRTHGRLPDNPYWAARPREWIKK